jgi:hypothetical protein
MIFGIATAKLGLVLSHLSKNPPTISMFPRVNAVYTESSFYQFDINGTGFLVSVLLLS